MYNYIVNGRQVFKYQAPTSISVMENMARRRKTGKSGHEWRRVFAEVAKKCAAEAKRRGSRYQDCIRQELARYKY